MVRCPTDVMLERYLAGACTDEETGTIRTHESSCPACTERIAEARAQEALAADVRRGLGRRWSTPTSASPRAADALPAEEPTLARYRILGELGRGGMGVVYEAEQREPRRRVALKVLRSELASEERERRFARETRVLGRLDHPGIAKILEGGTFESGGRPRPFFAMELVRGRPIVAHAREADLGVRERVALLAQVCDAVQHAHQKGVVHRDLKPSNLLVTEGSAPRVLDFGVARLVEEDAGVTAIETRAGAIVGTLAYMSPEQLAGDPGDVDTRSDVYSLGVVLFELLAGRLPHEVAGRPVPEAARLIGERDAPVLRSVDPTLAKDLEAIVARALARDRELRYPSAAALAEDLRRYLAGEPVSAKRPSLAYVLGKLVRRNRALAATVAALFLVLVVGVVATSVQSARATREARKTSEAIGFLKGWIGTEDELAGARPHDFTLREALDEAAARLVREPPSLPEIEAELRMTLGNAYRGLGAYEQAGEQLSAALELRRGSAGAGEMAGSLNALGLVSLQARDYAAAEDHFRESLALYRLLHGDESPEIANVTSNLGSLCARTDRLDEAEALLEEAFAMRRRVLPEDHPHFAASHWELGALRQRQGRWAEAADHYRGAVDAYTRAFGGENAWAASARFALGDALRAQGLEEDGMEEIRAALEALPDGAQSPGKWNELGRFEKQSGRYDEAREAFRASIDGHRAAGDEDAALTPLANLAALELELGELDVADALHRELLAALPGEDDPRRLSIQSNYAALLREKGDLEAAAELFEEAVEAARRTFGDGDARTLVRMNNLAQTQQDLGHLESAEVLLDEVVARARELDEHDGRMAIFLRNHGSVLLAQGRAEPARERFEEGLAIAREALPAEHPGLPELLVGYGRALMALDRPADAGAHFEEAYALLRAAKGEEDEATRAAAADLERCKAALSASGE